MTELLDQLAAPDVRFVAGEVAQIETTDTLTRMSGIAVPYGVRTQIGTPVGPFLEVFQRGAFARSVESGARGLPLHLFHEARQLPIGVSEEWRDEADGLHGVWRIADTQTAQEAARMARDGFLTGLSVGFQAFPPPRTKLDRDADSGLDVVTRVEARLLETSLVSTPAYTGSSVQWVRSAYRPGQNRPNVDYWKRELAALRDTPPTAQR